MYLMDVIADGSYKTRFKWNNAVFQGYYDSDTLAQELCISLDLLDWEVLRLIEQSGRAKEYEVHSWICTDTRVGLYIIEIDDKPLLLQYQSARKSYPKFYRLVDDAPMQVTAFIREMAALINDAPMSMDDPDVLLMFFDVDKEHRGQIDEHAIGLPMYPLSPGFCMDLTQHWDRINAQLAADLLELAEGIITKNEALLANTAEPRKKQLVEQRVLAYHAECEEILLKLREKAAVVE
jgi:hypothetical protein